MMVGFANFGHALNTYPVLPPSLSFISITGDCVEGEVLTASYGYVGGHEGTSQYSWYLHKVLAV